ncbi:Intracellular growth attenuator protein igaA [Erwinia sp. OLTSP20]|uniref:IgaA/UmoB family intracellular growth attenuator n=1 Tax=unclassified Erwinia TaxID=2622719 RepID=UPI000C179ECF|nr:MULTISPECIES: IgaA/UmoB family intracellular growth attenuator [unclassified Erwinia]PIJ51197.1 Intracellular growth attenuator protein igaA [Erwinia sp. OAMSP11]PIJ73949.1 Intracellular growth attenuator protein igaA [Erwinia sp. OLSSP12]PIJ83957.1 Intracellular growth attenuator protein igaA [Erwinia sp. OLCASP19]PIJ86487.1 Intracellular growth attenuator protein igaA [Erwinia sp. OLMTSP26]PIJ87966.1 Intracellular growth attenuator protein igaA [Erwinia sp. OLMDSP33]
MNTIAVIVLLVLLCSLLIAGYFWYQSHRQSQSAEPQLFLEPPHRKLTFDEQRAIQRYIDSLAKRRDTRLFAEENLSHSHDNLTLTSFSHNVYPLTRAITRYGLSTDNPDKWRYYLDEVEVHLPPQWEQYITDENYVELVRTYPVPLIISLNGHTLTNDNSESATLTPTVPPVGRNASIRQEAFENIELVRVRKETLPEYTLSRADGTREALLICFALLLFFISLAGPLLLMPWLIASGMIIVAVSAWLYYRTPGKKSLRDIHCLRGALKRWGLFSEASSQNQMNNLSLGSIDLIYPSHWLPYVAHDLGQTTEVEMYLNHHVVRQGRFLSLHDEARFFPVQRWRKNVVLAAGSLLVLALLVSWIPLSMPLKLSVAWLKGTESIHVNDVGQLEKTMLHVGDRLNINGYGMCSIPSTYQGNRSYVFMPFDCSAVYWNNAAPLPLPQSDIIDKATALLNSTHQQLHPQTTTDPKLNPQLATAIQKSGMILLDDFADIVLKTQDLCGQQQDCVRLKNALVNLGNAKDWSSLVRRADSGALNGMNVLLRPVSAEALENLVNTATTSFFYRETRRAADALNSPPPGGFLIISDEGHPLVNQPAPTVSLFDYNAPEQWPELQRLAGMLLHTPFSASGVITSINADANGTRHIAIHNEPDSITLWHYLGISLLLCLLLLSLLVNSLLALLRIHRNRVRMQKIQQHYESCMNPALSPLPPMTSLF